MKKLFHVIVLYFKESMKRILSVCMLMSVMSVMAGCATSSTGPVAAGPDTFVVSRQAGAFPSGREPLLAEALVEANAKCATVGKTMKLLSTVENPGPYVFGNYPKATVVFSCA
ncbi:MULTISPECIES: hypothetical protein [unclassified Janthinobacterium]|uniref:hypothetical protein n=1 Tax=unclassified Janthinobacterium TaxID=2610881 RepID=UPI0012EBAC26|nr:MULTISPECIES: hypothetical protein [unclassified Janthinobacterium]